MFPVSTASAHDDSAAAEPEGQAEGADEEAGVAQKQFVRLWAKQQRRLEAELRSAAAQVSKLPRLECSNCEKWDLCQCCAA